MKIVIVGGAGFIGKELSAAALEAGHEVISFDVAPHPGIRSDDGRYEYVCAAASELPEEKITGADGMVVLAARRPYDGFSYDDYASNVAVARECVECAVRCRVKTVVFASSKAVYSGGVMPWREGDFTVPSSLYGASKLAAEQLGLFLTEGSETSFVSLRFAQVIGRGERKGYLINTLIDNAAAKRPQIIFGTGAQRRHYVYVKDVCRAIIAALCAGKKGIYNIGMPCAVSNLEMAEAANRAFGNLGNVVHDNSRPMGDRCDEMSVALAAEELGFTSKYDIDGAFRDLAAETERTS